MVHYDAAMHYSRATTVLLGPLPCQVIFRPPMNPPPDHPNSPLHEKVRHAMLGACHNLPTSKELQRLRAYEEAIQLTHCGLFEGKLIPEVCLDDYGEFTFSHHSKAGYIDIGVRGVGKLSYHVRNDIEPGNSAYADVEWQDYHIPQALRVALRAIKEYL